MYNYNQNEAGEIIGTRNEERRLREKFIPA